MHEGPTENRLGELGPLYKYYYYYYYYKLTTHKFLKVSEASVNAWGHSRAATEQATVSLEVDLFRLNGFESYYKFTWEKWLTYAVLGAAWNITHCPIGQLSWRHW